MNTPYDSRWTLHVAYSLLTEGNNDLVEFQPLLQENDYRIQYSDGVPRTIFPDGAAISAIPFVGLLDLGLRAAGEPQGYRAKLELMTIGDMQELWGSLMVAAAGCIMFLVATQLGFGPWAALLLASLMVFATPAYSIASRALWSHTPLLLINSLLLLQISKSGPRPSPRSWAIIGLIAAIGVICRPTAALIVIALLVLSARTGQRSLWSLPVAFPSHSYGPPIITQTMEISYLAIIRQSGSPTTAHMGKRSWGTSSALGEVS